MHLFRMIDMHEDTNTGVLVDMEYEIVNGIEKLINISTRNIINNIVGKEIESNTIFDLAFASYFFSILEQERNKTDNV